MTFFFFASNDRVSSKWIVCCVKVAKGSCGVMCEYFANNPKNQKWKRPITCRDLLLSHLQKRPQSRYHWKWGGGKAEHLFQNDNNQDSHSDDVDSQ